MTFFLTWASQVAHPPALYRPNSQQRPNANCQRWLEPRWGYGQPVLSKDMRCEPGQREIPAWDADALLKGMVWVFSQHFSWHFLYHRMSISLRISATGPRTVFCCLQITCLGQSFSVGIQRFYSWENSECAHVVFLQEWWSNGAIFSIYLFTCKYFFYFLFFIS